MPMIVIDVPLSLAQLFVVVFVAVPAVCAVVTLGTERFYNYELRRSMRARTADVRHRTKLLDERSHLLQARDKAVSDREAAVTERERELRRTAKGASAAIHAVTDTRADDTLRSLLDWDDLPDSQPDDTVALPRIEDES